MANPWSAFYWRDYVADTGHLTLEEHGAYLLLMAHYYVTGKPIPADPDQLGRICRCLKHEDLHIVTTVLDQFFVRDGETYRHHRIEKEIAKQRRISAEYAARAKAGAAARWKKNATSNASSMSQAMLDDAYPQPQPQPIPKPKPQKPKSKAKTPLPVDFSISPEITTWAAEHKYTHLEERLAHFIDWAKAGDKKYADWNATFRNAIRGDWAHLGATGGKSNGRYVNKAEQRQADLLEACAEAKRLVRVVN